MNTTLLWELNTDSGFLYFLDLDRALARMRVIFQEAPDRTLSLQLMEMYANTPVEDGD